MPPAVLFHVQHLLGIGHVMRASAVASAMADAGLEVTVVSGGFPVPGADFGRARVVTLPPMRAADATFKTLLTEGDVVVDDAFKAARTERLLALYREIRPRVVMMEMFPFGRRQCRFELLPLIEAARADRAWVISSVRDILVRKSKPGREAEMADIATRLFDRVLVHGDPTLVRFEDTMPPAAAVADRLAYTGLVVRRATSGSPDGTGAVLVSAGGGRVGLPLFRAALAARPDTVLKDAPWRLLVGHGVPQEDFETLCAEAARSAPAGTVVVERARPDFPALLAGCALSISQAGYNTIMDVMQARCPAVLVPFSEAEESEQPYRARLLADKDLVSMVDDPPDPVLLARAINDRAGRPLPPALPLDLSGAETTARLIAGLAAGDPPPPR